MSSGLNKNHILEAIDKLRSRKSRPDVLRIVSYVAKKYEFPKNDIKEYLEMLSKDGTVLKVEFKGSISYRNAANYRNVVPKTLPNTNEETYSTDDSMSDFVVETLAQLIVQEPEYLDVGISGSDLFTYIDDRYKKPLTRNYFKEFLQNEVKNGNLVKFENGNYCLGYRNGEESSLAGTILETAQISTEKIKELAKNIQGNIKKYTSLSRHSSPCSSKNSHSSPLPVVERTSKVLKPSTSKAYTSKTYSKASRKNSRSHYYLTKDDGNDKKDMSPVRESSRRKRFQKIVFDPSDSPKPKKMKDRDGVGILHTGKKLRGPYNKKGGKEDVPIEKIAKKEGVIGIAKQASKMVVLAPKDERGFKTESEDESDNDNSSDDGKCCKICLFAIDFKSNRSSERWLSCQMCEKKAHVSCVEETELWTGFKLSKWQCNDCKSCVACKGSKNGNEVGLILCGLCDDAYHIKCANIKKSKTTQKWFCGKCSVVFSEDVKTEKEEFEATESTSNESSHVTTPDLEDKKSVEKGDTKSRKESSDADDIDETIPDCSNWTCEEVYSYFLKYVLPEEADVFRDQEIDGRVLLLLTRYDVLSDFKLKLGPALKIYAQVKRLQVRKNDPYLFWP